MNAAFDLLTSRIAALVYAGLVVALGVVSVVTVIQRNDARASLTRAENTVGQLKGSLDFQNLQVQQQSDLAVEKQLAAQSALAGATRARRTGDAVIAALRALPATGDPAKACIADSADDAVLEKIKRHIPGGDET